MIDEFCSLVKLILARKYKEAYTKEKNFNVAVAHGLLELEIAALKIQIAINEEVLRELNDGSWHPSQSGG